MEKSGDYIHRYVDFYHAFDKDFKGETFDLYPQIPFVSYQVVLGDMFFGRNLWFPRLINILLFMSAVVMACAITKKITGSSLIGLASAAVLSFLPLGVLFSRNLQPESGALFFALLTTWFIFKYFDGFRLKYLAAAGIGFAMVTAYKLSFLFILMPLLFIFPYPEYFRNKKVTRVLLDCSIFLLPLCLLMIFWAVAGQVNIRPSLDGRTDLLAIFKIDYWTKCGPTIWRYAVFENYGYILFLAGVAGVALAWLDFNIKTLFAGYLRACSIVLLLYFMVFSDYLNQHSYYQFPFLFFMSSSIIYFCLFISRRLFARSVEAYQKTIFVGIVSLILAFSYATVVRTVGAAFSFNSFGSDVAGEYIKAHTNEADKFAAIVYYQGYGVCIYAERKCGFVDDIVRFKEIENREHLKYAVILPFGFERSINPELLDYIYSSYSIDYLGFIPGDGRWVPQLMILKKGGKVDFDGFIKSNNQPKIVKTYQTANGNVPFAVLENKF